MAAARDRSEDATASERSAHAPAGAGTGRWARRFHVTAVFWYRLHLWAVNAAPRWSIPVLVRLFHLLFFAILRRTCSAIAENLVPVLGPCGWIERQRRAYRTLLAYAWCLTERYENLAEKRRATWRIEGEAHWRATAAGGGVILLTAHIGAWEAASMLPAAGRARRVHVVRETEIDPEAQEFVEGLLRGRSGGLWTTHFESGDAALGIELLDALRGGEIVALQCDRPRGGGRTIEAPLFGRSFGFPPGPATLARAAGVPLLPVFVFRESRLRYRIAFRPPVEVPSGDRIRADVEAAVGLVGLEVEWAIRQAPHQWFCFGRAWPHPPHER